MMHTMRLSPTPFARMAAGQKTIELRLYDEKRRKIAVGDAVRFFPTAGCGQIDARAAALHRFADFDALYGALPLDQCGYSAAECPSAHPDDMAAYYTAEQFARYGVVGIALRDVQAICDETDALWSPDVYGLLAPSVYAPTPEKLAARAAQYAAQPDVRAFTLRCGGIRTAILVARMHVPCAELLDFAVTPAAQRHGLGRRMLAFLFDVCGIETIAAETDNDAVGFYRRCGFSIAPAAPRGGTARWRCIGTRQRLSNL